jgi:hypothetical protein
MLSFTSIAQQYHEPAARPALRPDGDPPAAGIRLAIIGGASFQPFMPSQLHEALLLLFRNRPELAPDLLQKRSSSMSPRTTKRASSPPT